MLRNVNSAQEYPNPTIIRPKSDTSEQELMFKTERKGRQKPGLIPTRK